MLLQPWTWVAIAIVMATSHGYAYVKGRDSRNAEIVELSAAILAANTVSEELRKRDPIVTDRVIVQYVEQVKIIREIGPTIIEQVEVIRREAPDCALPVSFRLLHDAAAAGNSPPGAAAGTHEKAPRDDGISCADAAEIIARNYVAARENAAQLEALQSWVTQTGR